jgi:branched-chain amino acid transport system permease protein
MQLLVQQLINGLGIGSIYALWAVGYGVVYQILRLMHFAYGDATVLVVFIAFTMIVTLALPATLAVLVALAGGGLLGVLVYKTAYRPLVARGETWRAFMAGLGAALILRNLVQLSWGTTPRNFPELIPETVWDVNGVIVTSTPLISLSIAAVCVAAFTIFLKRDKRGQAILCTAEDMTTAQLMGINVALVIGAVYAISGAFGAAGMILYVSNVKTFSITTGFLVTLKAFTAAIMGGIGRIEGAILGGLLLGVFEALIVGYGSSLYRDAIVFGLLAAVLLFRPNGLVGRRTVVRL